MPERKDEKKEESLLWSGLKRAAGIAVGFIGAPLILGATFVGGSVGLDIPLMGSDFDEVSSFGKGVMQGASAFV